MVQHIITVSNILCRGVYVLGAFLVLAKKISFTLLAMYLIMKSGNCYKVTVLTVKAFR